MADTTHSPVCWDWGPAHYKCAVRKIERDEALLRQALTALEQIATDLPWELTGLQDDAIAALRERLDEGAEPPAPQQPAAGDGCHCATCTCNPNMTPVVRFDLSPAQMEGAIRDALILMGWTPPEGESVATVRAELSRALRLADDFAASLICTEGQELESGRWKLTGDQVEYGPHLQAAFEHLKWRGFADVTPLNDGLMVVFTMP